MKTVSVKVPNDIKMMLKEHREENEISQSEAVRRLLLDGLRDDRDLINEVQELRNSITCLQDDLEGIESSLRNLEEKTNNE